MNSNYPVVDMSESPKPIWDSEKRELRLGERVIKRFKWPAKNQVRLIEAFQRNDWPELLINPLPPSESVSAKSQLHDTIKCLNRHRIHEDLTFHGDGTGRGVKWSVVETAKNQMHNDESRLDSGIPVRQPPIQPTNHQPRPHINRPRPIIEPAFSASGGSNDPAPAQVTTQTSHGLTSETGAAEQASHRKAASDQGHDYPSPR